MSFRFSQNSLNRLHGVHPDLVKVATLAIEKTTVDFGISQGVRTKENQAELYAQGRTKPGSIVTWTLNSLHLPQKDGYGHAVDVVAFVKGKVSWEESFYKIIAKAFLEAAEELKIPVTWGGTWKKPDLPHFELGKVYRS
jgi:peptidoglycan L-alanyl-D-glutamate endopeptidase CwlK